MNNRVDFLTRLLNSCFDKACPLIRSRIKSTTPWWNAELTSAKQSTQQLRKLANRTKTNSDTDNYRKSYKRYNNLIKQAKREGWKKFCSNIKDTKETARLDKILNQGEKSQGLLNSVKKANGELTISPQETLTRLGEVLIPDNGIHESQELEGGVTGNLIHEILAPHRLDRAVKDLKKGKTPGPDLIRNEMISEAWGDINHIVRRIFIHSLTLCSTPAVWQESTGVIIPKPNKLDYTEPRAFRIIALTSCLQKLLERAILWHLQVDLKIPARLTKCQHGFKKGASTESAIHKLTRRIEDAKIHKQDAIGIFLDIEGAFDNISFKAIKEGLIEAGIPDQIARWIFSLTSNRSITLSYCGESVIRKATKGSAQGGVLSPLIWNITLDTFLKNLGINRKFVQAFADDLVIFISGICRDTVRDVTQDMLNNIERWCDCKGLKLSSTKTSALLFSTSKDRSLKRPLIVGNSPLTFSRQAVYLGVVIDQELSWKAHVDNKIENARKQLFNCQRAIGKTWGLQPYGTKFLYNQVILSSLTYGSVVWADKALKRKETLKKLNKLQYLAARMITRGLKSSASVNLEIIAGLLPIDIKIRSITMITAIRLKVNDKWDSNYQHTSRMHMSHAYELDKSINRLHSINSGTMDWIPKETVLDRRFRTIIEARSEAVNRAELSTSDSVQIFTDGSKRNNITGAGLCVYDKGHENHAESFYLGNMCTVFQSELFAIYRAAQWAISHINTPSDIIILSDSQAGIKALSSTSINSIQVKTIISALNELGKSNSVSVRWVPGHMGVPGNERADELAREGSSTLPIGPPPFVPIPAGAIKNEIRQLCIDEHRLRYEKHEISEKGRAWIAHIGNNGNTRLDTKSVTDTRILTWLFTGHSPLGYFQHKIGNFSSPNCEECPGHEETTEHYLAKCPAYAISRQDCLGELFMEPKDIMEQRTSKLLKCIH